ncbi:response regulator transcription factor [Oscillospiraceae bacterium OttesenSCG-928-G22]|nr:response regulator transcription factor [Oscillospiraceae bacterium OttesenSCG-928-G22]
MNIHILVIDHNPEVKEPIEVEWAKYNCDLMWVNDFSLAATELSESKNEYSLIAVKREHVGEALVPTLTLLRKMTTIPIIILSTEYCTDSKINCLGLGADAYLCIPETLAEGVATGYALIRRYTHWSKNGEEKPPMFFPGELFISREHRRVFFKGFEVKLTRKMFDVLLHLASFENKTLTYAEIYKAVWGDEYDSSLHENQLWCAIKGLRRRFRVVSNTPDYIQTERYIGYRFSSGAKSGETCEISPLHDPYMTVSRQETTV